MKILEILRLARIIAEEKSLGERDVAIRRLRFLYSLKYRDYKQFYN